MKGVDEVTKAHARHGVFAKVHPTAAGSGGGSAHENDQHVSKEMEEGSNCDPLCSVHLSKTFIHLGCRERGVIPGAAHRNACRRYCTVREERGRREEQREMTERRKHYTVKLNHSSFDIAGELPLSRGKEVRLVKLSMVESWGQLNKASTILVVNT